MRTIESVLDAFEPRDAQERADIERLRALLSVSSDLRPRSEAVHVTGSALVVDPVARRVLLRWHPRLQMWMQVGGHFDAGETDPFLVALREAREETGLTDLRTLTMRAPLPVQIVIVPVPAHGDEPAHEHADFRYVFATTTPDAIAPESADARLRWADFPTAIEETHEANLREFLGRTAAVIGTYEPLPRAWPR